MKRKLVSLVFWHVYFQVRMWDQYVRDASAAILNIESFSCQLKSPYLVWNVPNLKKKKKKTGCRCQNGTKFPFFHSSWPFFSESYCSAFSLAILCVSRLSFQILVLELNDEAAEQTVEAKVVDLLQGQKGFCWKVMSKCIPQSLIILMLP